MSLVRALGCCAATSLAVAYARSNDMYAKTEASSVDVPKSVELRCSPISPACSRARVFFQQINADVKHVGTSPLSNSISAGESDLICVRDASSCFMATIISVCCRGQLARDGV